MPYFLHLRLPVVLPSLSKANAMRQFDHSGFVDGHHDHPMHVVERTVARWFGLHGEAAEPMVALSILAVVTMVLVLGLWRLLRWSGPVIPRYDDRDTDR